MGYAEKVLPVMRGVREMLVSGWGASEVVQYKEGSAWGVVTAMDLAVEEKVSVELGKIFPDIAFEGEERGGARSGKMFWLMDPIDGTAHYVRGLPLCTSMLALIDNGQVVFSLIYDFLKDDMYWAEKGKGAFRNDTPINVSSRPVDQAYVGFETREGKPANAELWRKVSAQMPIVHTMTSGWEFAMLASGKIEGRIAVDPYGKDYDFAPGSLLVSEAGGIVANIGLSDYDYRNLNFIAASPAIYDALTNGKDAIFPVPVR